VFSDLFAKLLGWWKNEPLRLLALLALALNTLHDQLAGGVNWQTALVAVIVVVVTEIGRSQVVPAAKLG
jgi:hypothetical protein